MSVCVSVGHKLTTMSYANMESGGPKEPCIRWGEDPPEEGVILEASQDSQPIIKYREYLAQSH